MDAQTKVAEFIQHHELHASPVYRLLDLEAEVGELAKEMLESTSYGDEPAQLHVSVDELGDVLFTLLALASTLEIDADDALEVSLSKYERRLDVADDPSSGGIDR